MPEDVYYRPIAQTDACRPAEALPLAGGLAWFTHAEQLIRGGPATRVPISEIPMDMLEQITTLRAPVCGLSLKRPRLMGILNVTPDSFSDGGEFHGFEDGLKQARQMLTDGAEILDVGGESTRPGADFVSSDAEIARTIPVLRALRAAGETVAISIDTRKADVARTALAAGAGLINDVSALGFDPAMAGLVSETQSPVCLMHAKGEPKTMQNDPAYENVLLDVYDDLADRIEMAENAGIARASILVDPGIGFGKTLEHNMALIKGLSLFHGLGCAILLGVSRKRFIGTLGKEPLASLRAPGSIALGLEAARQGVQMLRVHDMRETRQALDLWTAANT